MEWTRQLWITGFRVGDERKDERLCRCGGNILRMAGRRAFLSPSPSNVVSETITGDQDNPSGDQRTK